MTKILLLEDDPNLAKTLKKFLTQEGYCVDWAKNGEEAVELSYQTKYLLYLFDINVPLLNGLELLESLRQAQDHTPTIIISALQDIQSIKEGFLAGADDYIKKPFDPDELLIRIQAKTHQIQEMLHYGEYRIDLKREEVYFQEQRLSMGEVLKHLFITLLTHQPNPVPKERLMEHLEKSSDVALRVNIAKLKKEYGVEIKNIRGVGYKII